MPVSAVQSPERICWLMLGSSFQSHTSAPHWPALTVIISADACTWKEKLGTGKRSVIFAFDYSDECIICVCLCKEELVKSIHVRFRSRMYLHGGLSCARMTGTKQRERIWFIVRLKTQRIRQINKDWARSLDEYPSRQGHSPCECCDSLEWTAHSQL